MCQRAVGHDWERVQKTTLASAHYHAVSHWHTKRKFKRITTRVFPHVTRLQCLYDKNILCGRWRKSLHANGLVGRDWQRVQKMTLVSACYHALILRVSKRKFKRITTRVSPHCTWLQCQYDRNCLRGRWRKSMCQHVCWPRLTKGAEDDVSLCVLSCFES